MTNIHLTALPAKLLRIVSSLTTLAVFTTALPQAMYANREGECESDIRDVNPGPGSLKRIRPVEPTGLANYVQNRQSAIILGKALFWDMQVGSDGIQSCGTCHFRAGADPRSKGQLAPGGLNNTRNIIDVGGNNYQLNASDFPLTKFANPTDRKSQMLRTSDDIVTSAGVHSMNFQSATPGAEQDNGTLRPDPVFHVAGVNVRRAEPRNTPTMINAAFSRRTFWDGRADHIFNGVNPFGVRDPNARVLKATNRDVIEQVKVRIDNAALASQAVGPPTSDLEMSFFDRPLRDVGRRLLAATPLAKQEVDEDDSVLGLVSNGKYTSNKKGLLGKYLNYVQVAFKREWWDSSKIVSIGPNNSLTFMSNPGRALAANEYTMAEYNFSLFLGLAIQLYEMTLISDDAPIDRFFDGNTRAISDSAKRGLDVFKANACAGCHSGAEFTNSSVRILLGAEGEPAEIIERMPTGNCNIGLYDQSFYNIGVRPYWEDLGIGNNDPFGNPLAIAKVLTMPPGQVPSQELLTISYPNIVPGGPRIGERTIAQGAFKVPSLRNIELTAPYFHNGGHATLRQAVEFYNRGGDFRDTNVEFVDLEIGKLNLTEQQIDDVVEFMKTLTDERVRRAAAPFDHPQLFVPNGADGDTRTVRVGPNGVARDVLVEIKATGRDGGPVLKGFLE